MSVRIATLIAAVVGAAAIGLASPAHARSDCPPGYYPAASGDCVPDPKKGPADRPPTAICRDGDYSYSEHPHSGGTCHGHGGVAQVLAP
jgi:Protein of unknown function (DUF3761)